jgi:hypothetical protein
MFPAGRGVDGGALMKKTIFLGFAILFLAAGSARAQPLEVGSEARGVRGAIGMGLIGMELTMTIEAAAGVTNPWLLSIIPLVVGGGAAAGGYYIEQESSEGGVAVLAIGMTLLVPSILLTLVLSSETYEAPEGSQATVTTEPEPRGGGTATRAPALARAMRSRALPSLVAVRDGDVQLGVPSLTILEAPTLSLYPAAAPSSGFEYQLSLVDWAF